MACFAWRRVTLVILGEESMVAWTMALWVDAHGLSGHSWSGGFGGCRVSAVPLPVRESVVDSPRALLLVVVDTMT